MKKIITSFGIGYHSKLLSLSCPTFYMYAYNHNYDLFVPSNNFFSNETKQMSPSWWKLDVIEFLLKEYDQVLWLDADVIICRFETDIAESLDADSHFGVVVHQTSDGQIPNCGVWLLNKSCLEWIHKLKNLNTFKRSSCWWEQAALLYLLGIDPDSTNISLPSNHTIPWTSLDYCWNPHINDARKIPKETRFFHATCFNDRYLAMKNILQQINI